MLRLLLLIALIGFGVWWWKWETTPAGLLPLPAETAAQIASRSGTEPALTRQVTNVDCPKPDLVGSVDLPAQGNVPAGLRALRHGDGTLVPLASFSVDGRVLSAQHYSMDREADYAPVDLALGWGPMRRDAVLEKLDISQSGRWYFYRWQNDPPIPAQVIRESSANMHMIPSNHDIALTLKRIERGQRVQIDGWLVEVQAPDGWRWRSSTNRQDSGAGGCEVIYVCRVLTN